MAEAKAKVDPLEELVEVELFYDGEKYSDDVFVCVNGERCQIQRGVPVKIKRKFKNVLDDANAQTKSAATLMKQLQNDYKKKEKELN